MPDDKPQGREEIIAAVMAAAERLFSERPFKDVTTREIADLANVNLGLIHRHLGSKEHLLERVMVSYAERFKQKALEAPDAPAALQYLSMNPHQLPFLRTVALQLLSPVTLDTLVTRDGGVSILLRMAEADRSGKEGSNAAPHRVVAALAMMMGWTLFKPFLQQASGLGAEELNDEKLQALMREIISADPQ